MVAASSALVSSSAGCAIVAGRSEFGRLGAGLGFGLSGGGLGQWIAIALVVAGFAGEPGW